MEKIEVEVIHKEIDLIQACITRMANNSFLLKGWAISIVAIVLALTEKNTDPIILSLIVLVPLLSFWYLDAFFLRIEQMYRKMYEWVIKNRMAQVSDNLYDLNPYRFKNEVKSHLCAMWSITLRCFYGIPTLIVLLIIAFQLANGDKIHPKKDVISTEIVNPVTIKLDWISNESNNKKK